MARSQASRRKPSARSASRPRVRLAVEALESRTLLSANDFPTALLGIDESLLGNHDPSPVQVDGQTRYVIAGQWLAKFDNLAGQTRADQLASAQALLQPVAAGLQAIDHTGTPGLVVLQTAPDVPQAAVQASLATVSGFQYVEPYYVDYGPKKSLFWAEDNDVMQQPGLGANGSPSGPGAPPGLLGPGPLAGPSTNVKVLNGFDGINFGQSGGWTPPDTDGAVGPTSFIQNVNSSIAIYNKATGAALAGPTAVGTFWAPEGESAFYSDPVAVYDEFAQKFVVVEGNFNNNHAFVAVSKTSSPTTLDSTSWNFYKYAVNDGTGAGMDYPKIGYNKDGYVLSYNMFPYYYDHSTTLSIRKSDMAGFVNVVPGGFSHFTLAPATMHTSNAGDPMWFVEDGHTGGGGSTVNVVKMTNPYSSSPTFATTALAVTPYGDAPNPRQPGAYDLGNRTSLGTRFFFAGLRQVGSQTLLVSSDAVGANNGAQARWYEFNVAGSSPTLVQQGAVNQGTGVDTFYPDVDIAAGGTLGMTFDQSSATAPGGYLSMYVTGRNPGDPSGTMQTPALAKQGLGTLNAGGRGGDYSMTSIDPTDGTFWATNEYAPQATGGWNWATYITHFRVAPPAGPSVVSQTPSGDQFGTVSSVRLTFDEPIQASSFDLTQVDSFTGPGGAIAVNAVTPVAGSNNTQFDLSFAAQSALGNYTLVVGPNILDAAGHPMDQNHNGIAGENPGDRYTGSFALQGLKVTASTPSGNFLPNTVTDVTLTFNEAVDPTTLTPGQIAFTGPGGPTVNRITALDSSNTRFDINFDPLTATGLYKMTIGPNVQDTFGHKMDQNGNFIPGEAGDTYTLQFGVTGPKILSSSPSGGFSLPGVVSTLFVTFNESMNPAGFAPSDVSITDPTGAAVNVNSVTAVAGTNNTLFSIKFDPAGITGIYNVVVGPHIADTYGNEMDQNGNLIPGETPGDQYKTTLGVLGPRVNFSQALPSGSGSPGYDSSVRFYFNESMDPATFTASQVKFTGPAGAIAVGPIVAVGGTNNTQFDVTFAPQTGIGRYTMVVGPNVLDYFGNAMDQNGNLKPGEPTDTYTATFSIAGPRIVSSTPFGTGNLPGTVDHVRVTFNESMDANTFTTDAVTFTGPGNTPVTVNDVSPVADTGATQFDISFAPLTATGFYTMVIGPHVMDLNGNAMDQNNNYVPGETPGDQYRTAFGIAGPHVLSATRAAFTPVNTVHVVFSEPMDPTTFTASQIVSFTDPTGKAIAVTGITPTTDDNSQFDITFANQTAAGNYTLVLGSGIQDAYGNKMDQNGNLVPGEIGDRYTVRFRAVNPVVGPDGFGYTGDGTYGYEDHEIAGLPGTFTILQSSGGYYSPTPAVDLGVNTFTFYGKTYTGNNQLFVSAFGLVSFGSGVSYSYNYYNLSSYPQQAIIAPLWDNWFKFGSSTAPMVLGRFEDTTGSGTPDRLVIEWSQVQQYYYPSETPITFQLILGLNGAPTDTSPITFNYGNLDTGDYYAFGGNATVGMKDVGTQGTNRLLVSYHEGGVSPFLQSQQAIQFTAPSFGGTIQGNVYSDDNGNGTQDPGESGLSGATVFLDLNRIGTYDPNDPTATTDDSGNYAFTNVVPGSYSVGVVPPDGTVQTQPVGRLSRSVEDFETGNLSNYNTQYSYYSQFWGETAAAKHDGNLGLSSSYYYSDWIYRNDGGAQVQQGDTVSAWVQFNTYAYGRAYFGFGASAGGTLALVLASDSNQFLIQQIPNYNYYQDLAATGQTYQANHWYRVEVQWGIGGQIVGRLYDSNGTTLLRTVTATSTQFTSGGLAFRGYSNYYYGRVYFDTVTTPGVPGEYPVSIGIRQTVTVGNFGFYSPPPAGGSSVAGGAGGLPLPGSGLTGAALGGLPADGTSGNPGTPRMAPVGSGGSNRPVAPPLGNRTGLTDALLGLTAIPPVSGGSSPTGPMPSSPTGGGTGGLDAYFALSAASGGTSSSLGGWMSDLPDAGSGLFGLNAIFPDPLTQEEPSLLA